MGVNSISKSENTTNFPISIVNLGLTEVFCCYLSENVKLLLKFFYVYFL